MGLFLFSFITITRIFIKVCHYDAYEECFTSVSNGKSSIASAITDKGVSTSDTDTFAQMASNIAAISGNSLMKTSTAIGDFGSGYITFTTVKYPSMYIMVHPNHKTGVTGDIKAVYIDSNYYWLDSGVEYLGRITRTDTSLKAYSPNGWGYNITFTLLYW